MNQESPIRLGTRGSALAMWQAETVEDLLSREAPTRDVDIVTVKTLGDRVQDAKLSEIGRTGVFTVELDRALLADQIDVAVHSLKDVETTLPAGLVVAAVLPRGPVEDALVASVGFNELPKGARIGTSSVRRVTQIARLRPDLVCDSIRGNVPGRIAKLDAGEYGGLIMARAGLVRLGLAHRIATTFAPTEVLPAVGQGAVCVITREDDEIMRGIVGRLNHIPTWRAVTIERACLRELASGCNVPLGMFISLEGESVRVAAGVYDTDGGDPVLVDRTFTRDDDSEDAGRAVAEALRAGGARIPKS